MNDFSKDYYLNNSTEFGWGEVNAKPDTERVQLLEKFISGKTVLDMGCGFGIYVDLLSKKGFDVTGLDLVGKFVETAKQNKQGKFVKGTAQKTPFANNQFETVILFDVLEHGDDLKILNEAKRIAQKRILIIVPKIVDKRLSSSGVIYRHYIDKSHLREYQEEDFKSLAKKTNLKVTNCQSIHPLYNGTIFFELFEGSKVLKKIIRKLVLMFLKKRDYPTEIFAVLDK